MFKCWPSIITTSQQKRNIHPTLLQCWPIVQDAEPTSYQHLMNLSCLLGLCFNILCSYTPLSKHDGSGACLLFHFHSNLWYVGPTLARPWSIICPHIHTSWQGNLYRKHKLYPMLGQRPWRSLNICTLIIDQMSFWCGQFWNELFFRPPLCSYRLNWARRTSWGVRWMRWHCPPDTGFKIWASRSQRLPTVLNRNSQLESQNGVRTCDLRLSKQAAFNTALSIVGSLRDREVACSASDRQGANPVSGGQCHLIHLIILRRFSWPSLGHMCTRVA